MYKTYKGETKPNKVSWMMLSFLAGIVLWAQIDAKAGWAIVSVAVSIFNILTILLIANFRPQAYWKAEKRDYLFALTACVGVALWQITDKPNLAILFSIMANFLAYLPTLIKSYKHPSSEAMFTFAIWAFAHAINVLTIDDWAFSKYGFPTYLVLINLITVAAMLVKKAELGQPSTSLS